MTLHEQLQALVAASGGGAELASPMAVDPLGMQPPPVLEAELAVSTAVGIDDLLKTADEAELRTTRDAAAGDPMLREAIEAELDRRRR